MRRTFQDFNASDPDLLGAVVGPDMVCDSEQSDETAWDDIESELSCSAREAHLGFLSFPGPGLPVFGTRAPDGSRWAGTTRPSSA
jgi:hypothetical protein